MPNSLHMNLWSEVCGVAKFGKAPHRNRAAQNQAGLLGVPVRTHLPLDLRLSFYHLLLLVSCRSLSHMFQLLVQHLFFFLFLNLVFWDRASCRIGWPWFQYVAEEGLKVLRPATSSSSSVGMIDRGQFTWEVNIWWMDRWVATVCVCQFPTMYNQRKT